VHQKLTDLTISAIIPPTRGQAVYKDALSPLQVRVSPGGAKTFFTVVGKGKRHTIGRVGEVSLKAARDVARRIRAEKTLGRYFSQSADWITARDEYLAEAKLKRRAKTYREYDRILKRYFDFTGQLKALTKRDVLNALGKIESRSQRDHALVAVRVFFRWAVAHGYLDADPTNGVSRTQSTSRARVLTDEELGRIWRACEQSLELRPKGHVKTAYSLAENGDQLQSLPANFARIVQLLILTGQRRGEIAALQSSWINLNQAVFILPASITKNGREQTIPIGSTTQTLLNSSMRDGLLFTARGSTSKPFNGWSKSKAALDKVSGVTDWTMGDSEFG